MLKIVCFASKKLFNLWHLWGPLTCDSDHLTSMLAGKYATCLLQNESFETKFDFDKRMQKCDMVFMTSIDLPHHMSPKTVPNQVYSIVKLPTEE